MPIKLDMLTVSHSWRIDTLVLRVNVASGFALDRITSDLGLVMVYCAEYVLVPCSDG